MLVKLRHTKKPVSSSATFNGCTIIIPAYNEAEILKEKITNTLSLQHNIPVQIIVVTDGSTDGSEVIAAGFPGITVLHQPERAGKAAAINRAVTFAGYDVLLFTDANTFLNSDALLAITASLSDTAAGAVCGEKRIRSLPNRPNAETLYWKYESALKKLESKTGSVVGAAGELFAVKRTGFEPIPENIMLDDFWLSMRIREKGYKIVYEPRATATELPPQNLQHDFFRRARIAAGAWQWMKEEYAFTRLKKDPFFFWQFLSHRYCRWFVAPVCFLLMAVCNLYIVCRSGNLFFNITLGMQAAFLLCAIMGALPFLRRRSGLFGFPFYFIFTHICLLAGYLQRRRHSVLWKKPPRTPPPGDF